jgi:HD-like signal output (HDOD) protein
MMPAPMSHESAELGAIQLLSNALSSPGFRPPMLPAVAREALRIARDPDAGLKEMAELISIDQVLAARFLAVANSPLYRRKLPALSVHTALVRIGLENARDVLIFASLEPFLFTSRRFAGDMQELRKHSLAVSYAAGYLARLRRVPPGDASLAGLVHDIGAAALLKYIADNAMMLAGLLVTPDGVKHALRLLHGAAGQRLCQQWNLPLPIQQVTSEHQGPRPGAPILVTLVAAADELATRAGGGVSFDAPEPGVLDAFVRQDATVKSAVTQFADKLAEM